MPLHIETTINLNPDRWPSFCVVFSVFTSVLRKLTNKSKKWPCISFGITSSIKANGCSGHHSVECIQLYFKARLGLRSNMQGGKKRSWPDTRPAFPRGNKVLVVAQELAKAKQSELWQKLNSMLCEPAGKPLEMLQSCLNFARQELPLCGTCNYQPCAMQEGIMARIRWVPNACFKLYACKALKKLLWTWMSWQKFRLSTLVLEMMVESLTHLCKMKLVA